MDRFAAILLVLISTLRDDPDQVEELGWFVSKETLKITDEPVDISLASSFVDNILVIIISKAAGQLLVVHLWFVFPITPPPRNLAIGDMMICSSFLLTCFLDKYILQENLQIW